MNASDPRIPGEDQGWEGVGKPVTLAKLRLTSSLLIRRWCGRKVECGSVDRGAVQVFDRRVIERPDPVSPKARDEMGRRLNYRS